jgi:hypothetical protein
MVYQFWYFPSLFFYLFLRFCLFNCGKSDFIASFRYLYEYLPSLVAESAATHRSRNKPGRNGGRKHLSGGVQTGKLRMLRLGASSFTGFLEPKDRKSSLQVIWYRNGQGRDVKPEDDIVLRGGV